MVAGFSCLTWTLMHIHTNTYICIYICISLSVIYTVCNCTVVCYVYSMMYVSYGKTFSSSTGIWKVDK